MSMFQITWDEVGDRIYETGVDRGVLYPGEDPGVPWNGLLSVQEKPTGGEVEAYWFDGIKYLNLVMSEDFAATLEAFTYPREFEQCDGSVEFDTGLYATQQLRVPFGLSYRTGVGNDVDGDTHGYKIHLVYNAMVAPVEKTWRTRSGGSLSPSTFTWDISTTPVYVPGAKPTAHLVIDTTRMAPEAVAAIEDIIYGTGTSDARLPSPEELVGIAPSDVTLTIFDNGDGTWTASGQDTVVQDLGATLQIDSPSAVPIDANHYTVETI